MWSRNYLMFLILASKELKERANTLLRLEKLLTSFLDVPCTLYVQETTIARLEKSIVWYSLKLLNEKDVLLVLMCASFFSDFSKNLQKYGVCKAIFIVFKQSTCFFNYSSIDEFTGHRDAEKKERCEEFLL